MLQGKKPRITILGIATSEPLHQSLCGADVIARLSPMKGLFEHFASTRTVFDQRKSRRQRRVGGLFEPLPTQSRCHRKVRRPPFGRYLPSALGFVGGFVRSIVLQVQLREIEPHTRHARVAGQRLLPQGASPVAHDIRRPRRIHFPKTPRRRKPEREMRVRRKAIDLGEQ